MNIILETKNSKKEIEHSLIMHHTFYQLGKNATLCEEYEDMTMLLNKLKLNIVAITTNKRELAPFYVATHDKIYSIDISSCTAEKIFDTDRIITNIELLPVSGKLIVATSSVGIILDINKVEPPLFINIADSSITAYEEEVLFGNTTSGCIYNVITKETIQLTVGIEKGVLGKEFLYIPTKDSISMVRRKNLKKEVILKEKKLKNILHLAIDSMDNLLCYTEENYIFYFEETGGLIARIKVKENLKKYNWNLNKCTSDIHLPIKNGLVTYDLLYQVRRKQSFLV